jgi:hypothetical protein
LGNKGEVATINFSLTAPFFASIAITNGDDFFLADLSSGLFCLWQGAFKRIFQTIEGL